MKEKIILAAIMFAIEGIARAQPTQSCCNSGATFNEGGHVGGGDLCKNEIDKHRLAILGWIQRDEAKDLDFSKAKVAGLNYGKYRDAMLDILQEGKVIVTCYLDPSRISDPQAKAVAKKEGVSYKSITIGNPAKPVTCINYEDAGGKSHIDCNYDAILAQAAAGSPNYMLTHHEFASVAGVEMRTGGYVSDFSISNQLAEYEHWQSVKVLGPKRTTGSTPFCENKISTLIDFFAESCFKYLRAIPRSAVSSDDPLEEAHAVMGFDRCMTVASEQWKSGFGSTCAGPDAQDACLNYCKSQGLLKYCFEKCSQF